MKKHPTPAADLHTINGKSFYITKTPHYEWRVVDANGHWIDNCCSPAQALDKATQAAA